MKKISEASATISDSTQDCPQCGFKMPAIAGRKDARCKNCGYKESCCY
ncbi:MAG: hypothetical protein Q7K43_01165 [Candidatus Woesearchaeota archaeon]|nr:hypothetical protein [Candidatus Woesearchaeota archaeon]